MREEWNDRAQRNWRRAIWAEASDSEESFRASGARDYRKYVEPFLSLQGIDPSGLTALEIGAGVGRVSEFLCQNFRALVAVDISKAMLSIGRKRFKAENMLWLCNDGRTLKAVADASVDFVFSYGVFQQFPDPATTTGYLKEAGRVLKAGGWCVFQVMNQPHISIRRWRLALIISHRFRLPRIRIYRVGVFEACPIRMGILRKACKQSGLEVRFIRHRFTRNTWVWARKVA